MWCGVPCCQRPVRLGAWGMVGVWRWIAMQQELPRVLVCVVVPLAHVSGELSRGLSMHAETCATLAICNRTCVLPPAQAVAAPSLRRCEDVGTCLHRRQQSCTRGATVVVAGEPCVCGTASYSCTCPPCPICTGRVHAAAGQGSFFSCLTERQAAWSHNQQNDETMLVVCGGGVCRQCG